MRLDDAQFNRLQVLKTLRRTEPVSRTELAAATGLNAATITGIVSDLVARGMVVEEKVSPAGMGRPRMNLKLASGRHFTIGATMRDDGRIDVGIVDLRGREVFAVCIKIKPLDRLEALAEHVAGHIADTLRASGIERERILQVGIGLPAVIDCDAGVVHFLETFEPGPCPFAAIVEGIVGIPVSVDNNASLLASCEHWYGDRAANDNVVVVVIGLGLTAATYRDGQVRTGRHGFEPEFGHVKIVPVGGRPCICGGRGCLQAYSSISGVIDQIRERAGKKPMSSWNMHARFASVVQEDGAFTPHARDVLDDAGTLLGTAVANLVNMDDPERVVLLVSDNMFREGVEQHFHAAFDAALYPPLRGKAEVCFKLFNVGMYARGAAALTLERFYQSRDIPGMSRTR